MGGVSWEGEGAVGCKAQPWGWGGLHQPHPSFHGGQWGSGFALGRERGGGDMTGAAVIEGEALRPPGDHLGEDKGGGGGLGWLGAIPGP